MIKIVRAILVAIFVFSCLAWGAMLVPILCSCGGFQECNDMEKRIAEICARTDTVYTIPLASLTDFKWDTLYVIGGTTVDNEVEEFIGIRYRDIVPDGTRQYIFVKDNEIVQEYCSSSSCLLVLSKNRTDAISYEIGDKWLYTSVIRVQKRQGEGHFLYRVDEAK